MAQISGVGTIWNLPNYSGMLFTADMTETPILTAIGGLNRAMLVNDFNFVVGSEYDYPAAEQPAITETASLTAPTAVQAVRDQTTNVTQIFQEAVNISYVKLSNGGRMSGVNTMGQANNVQNEKNFQIAYNMGIIARNFEYTIMNGSYQIATSAAVANKTRGLLELCDDAASTDVAAAGADLSKEMIESLMQQMHDGGARFSIPVFIGGSYQIQKLNDIYGFAPADRTIGGLNVQQIITPLGTVYVMKPHRFMNSTYSNNDKLVLADLATLGVKFQDVPGMPAGIFYEPLAKTGAAEKGQLFGQLGFDHGLPWMHGKITGLSTS